MERRSAQFRSFFFENRAIRKRPRGAPAGVRTARSLRFASLRSLGRDSPLRSLAYVQSRDQQASAVADISVHDSEQERESRGGEQGGVGLLVPVGVSGES